jgi:membrane-bound lytic murein transglycosylase A
MNSQRNCGIILSLALLFVGCKAKQKPQYDRPLGFGQSALRLLDPAEIPDFSVACRDLSDLRGAAEKSLHYLSKPSSREHYPIGDITHDRARQSLEALVGWLDSGLTGEALHAQIRENFDVYQSVGYDDEGSVFFTGYYTPIFTGSKAKTQRFRYPLYQSPDALVKDMDGTVLGYQDASGSITAFPPRAQLQQSGLLDGKELVWLGDPFEAYIAQVQGTVKITLEDGQLQTYGYAASNGHEYHSIANDLVEDGKIPAERLSLAAMINYFKAHSQEIDRYINRNPRFIFFRKSSGPPRGSLNEPVTAMRSVATDKKIFPRGCLTFVQTPLPQVNGRRIDSRMYEGFALDQDTGGAIRAPGRCDIYMGLGAIPGRLAGQTHHEGKLFYLLLKLGNPMPPSSLSN